MSNITITEAKKKPFLIDERDRSVSVCAYCRVSTAKSDQNNSFESQKRFFENEFARRGNWVSRQIFADQGISGTSLQKRDEFVKMFELALEKKFDLILTKEVSRFSRNVQDTLNLVSKLKEVGVNVWFLSDNIYTEEEDYRERLIKASEQAESESRKTSRRSRWGQRRQMENGVIFGRADVYGYHVTRDENGHQIMEVIPEEAEIVRRIFELYAAGVGTSSIARKLEKEGIRTKQGKSRWLNTTILRILKNERYVGDLELGKTFTSDFLTHKRKVNNGESAKIYIKDRHPEAAIVERELWQQVADLLKKNTKSSEKSRNRHSRRYWCSGKIFCGTCGGIYISSQQTMPNGELYRIWKCYEAHQKGTRKEVSLDTGEIAVVGCNAKSVNEKVLTEAMREILTGLFKPHLDTLFEEFEKVLKEAAEESGNGGKAGSPFSSLQQQKKSVHDVLTNLTLLFAEGKVPESAYRTARERMESELSEIAREENELLEKSKESENAVARQKRRLLALSKALNFSDKELNESIYRGVVDRILVMPGNVLKIYFSGLVCPIVLRYQTKGRGNGFSVNFEILPA